MHWLIIASVLLLAYSLVDVVATDTHLIRQLPKPVWVVVVLVPFFGGLMWLLAGRPRGGSLLPGTTGDQHVQRPSNRSRPLAPDDDPEFLRRLRDPRDER
ncbi:MAG: PLDc N-terminal domain-containing protein [Mycobacteriales bacterium]